MKILITGATSGIGEACARLFAQQGCQLILTGRRLDRLNRLKKELQGQGKSKKAKIQIAQFDIQSQKQVQNFLKTFAKDLKTIDVLINNAGLAKGSEKMQEARLEDWQQMLQTNVMGLLYLTRGVLPHMLTRNQGFIVNLGSVAGRWVYQGGAVYCASKFAVRAISEGLRMDLMGKNIRVCNIEPGMVETEFSMVRFGDQKKADQVYAGMKALTAADIAETISWVIHRPPHVNIQELVIMPTDQAAVGMVHRK